MFKKGSFDVLDIGTVWPTARVLSNLLHQEWNIFFITNLQKAATDSSMKYGPRSCRSHWNPNKKKLFPFVSTIWFNGSNQILYLLHGIPGQIMTNPHRSSLHSCTFRVDSIWFLWSKKRCFLCDPRESSGCKHGNVAGSTGQITIKSPMNTFADDSRRFGRL